MPELHENKNLETVISEHGKTLADQPSASTELEDRLDKIEVLIEAMGHVTDLRGDLHAVRRTRFWMIVISLLFIFSVDGSVFYLMFHQGAWYWLQDSYFKSVVFLGSLTASVVLLSIMIKGAFHSLADRAKDDVIPPHVKEGMDALRLLLGK
jgi:hypothetical protein